MGIQERKQRYKEDFRSKILEAAKKLFVTEGIEATSIRKIAREIEFSPTTIYLYYKDKKEIVYALHREGFIQLGNQMQPLMHVEDPFERLKALGKIYISFAVANPDFYEVIFILKDTMRYLDDSCATDEWAEGDTVFNFLVQTILDCQSIGYFAGMDPKILSMQAWSTVHGIVSLYITGHLQKLKDISDVVVDPKTTIDCTFQIYISMLEKIR